jgi:hypothetical protein
MGFIHAKSSAGILRLEVTRDMWIYFAITAPLMLITLLGWWLWEVRIRRRAGLLKARDEEDGQKIKNV